MFVTGTSSVMRGKFQMLIVILRFAAIFSCVLIVSVFGYDVKAYALDTIILNPLRSENDRRGEYRLKIIESVLERTIDRYGPYEIQTHKDKMSRKRALVELVKGTLTVMGVPTKPEWEEKAIPIRIPVQKGLAGYKLLLINESNQDLFSKIKDQEGLMKFQYGGGEQWSITLNMRKLGFKIQSGNDYEGLFRMLVKGRFDFFPRGVNEIFNEYDDRKDNLPGIIIEKSLALYIPQPNYFFVSPTTPKIAKRLEEGLLSIIADGTFDKMFKEYFGEFIRRANLDNRRIIYLENLTLSDKTPLNQPQLWYQPSK